MLFAGIPILHRMIGKYLQLALNWSEVWALLFPLFALLLRPVQPSFLKPVIVYVWLAFAINLIIDVIMGLNVHLKQIVESNNPFYNLHSVVRFACFSIFFLRLRQANFLEARKWLPVIFGLFLLVNFSVFENFLNPKHLSGNLFTAESYLLLVYCLLYYLSELKSDEGDIFRGADFWITTGLAIYVVINFFVFLFYVPMLDEDIGLALDIWYVHNIAFILFCLFITKAFYVSAGNKYAI